MLIVSGAGQTVKDMVSLEDAPPLPKERAKAQISKLGATPFKAGEIYADDGLNIRISSLNAMRRAAIEKISGLICESFKKDVTDFVYKRKDVKKEGKTLLISSVSTDEQAKAVSGKCDALCIPLEYINTALELADKTDVYLSLPTIIEKNCSKELRNILRKAETGKIRGIVCRSLDAISLASEFALPIIGGYSLNLTNGLAADVLSKMGVSAAVASAELSLGDIKSLAHQTDMPIGFVLYGRLRLMQTKHCFMKHAHCENCEAEITDRTGAVFPIRRAYPGHGNIIYNSRPIYLADKPIWSLGAAFAALCFTTETPQECENIIDMYKMGESPSFEFTRGGQSGKNW